MGGCVGRAWIFFVLLQNKVFGSADEAQREAEKTTNKVRGQANASGKDLSSSVSDAANSVQEKANQVVEDLKDSISNATGKKQ